MAERKPRVRNTRRVTDTEPSSGGMNRTAKHRGSTAGKKAGVTKLYEIPEGSVYEITAQASELVPVAQYANVTIGPVAVTRQIIVKTDDEEEIGKAIVAAMSTIQEACQEVIAEDREIVEESVRLHNQREADEAKKNKRG